MIPDPQAKPPQWVCYHCRQEFANKSLATAHQPCDKSRLLVNEDRMTLAEMQRRFPSLVKVMK